MRNALSLGCLLLLNLSAGAQTNPGAAATAPQDASADAILYYRSNPANRAAVTLSLALISSDGIASRNVAVAGGGLGPGLVGIPLCAAAGRLYLDSWGMLLSIDLSTGQVSQLLFASSFAVHDGEIFATQSSPLHLVVIDAASQSSMDLVNLAPELMNPPIRSMLPSPDGRHIACLAPTSLGGRGERRITDTKLILIDLPNRSAITLFEKMPFRLPNGAAAAYVSWRDNQSLFTITNDPPVPGGAPTTEFLTYIDINTARLTRVCSIPNDGGGVMMNPETSTSELALQITPLGKPPFRAAFDKSVPEVREALTRLGRFHVEGSLAARGPKRILLNGQPIIEYQLAPSSGPVVSSDGRRLLYSLPKAGVEAGRSELHCFDADTHSDRVVGELTLGVPFAWLPSSSLTTPKVAPTPPEGFKPVVATPFPLPAATQPSSRSPALGGRGN